MPDNNIKSYLDGIRAELTRLETYLTKHPSQQSTEVALRLLCDDVTKLVGHIAGEEGENRDE